MPGGISKLKELQFLSDFVVGRQEENGIQELGGLVNLHGTFEIKKLENVVEGKEARSARIIDKNHIDYLLLKWCSDDDMVSNTQTERDILDSLRLHHGLKELAIDGYRGTIFPDWFGHSSYQNMTRVSLVYCKNCCMLPSLGQMPSLKSLWIQVWRIWKEKSCLLLCYYFKFKTVLRSENAARRVADKLSMKGPEEINGSVFFIDSAMKMCIMQLLWPLQLGEHVTKKEGNNVEHIIVYLSSKF
ncbi:Putative disease resistance protein [Arachis hypogaea]|nr:Putative disease resistance protein [Arachis hypogaea]